MEGLILTLGWVGIVSPLALGAIGSMIGSGITGMSACGALMEVEGGYGRYIGLTAMPSSQTIYGIVVMFALQRDVTLDNAPGLFAIGFLTGLALLASALWQGRALASAINAAKAKPEVFGISIAPAAIIEGFAVFAFVFALVIGQGVPS
jgi:V/A-type H+-transporting ATPase subunit K